MLEHRADLAEQTGEILRLHHHDDRVGDLGGLGVVEHPDAVFLAQLGLALRPLIRRDDLLRAPTGADQTGDDGLPHHACPEDREHPTFGHCGTSFAATISAICTVLRAAPLRRLSLEMKNTSPLPAGAA